MSHLHVPDGLLPAWIIVLGWVATGAILMASARRLRSPSDLRHLSLLGVMAALMLVSMIPELPLLGYHVDLAVLAGIILGPGLGVVAAFIVNLILSFIGHGGVTVVGLNTVVIGAETVFGFYSFHAIRTVLGTRGSIRVAAGLAAVVSLLLSTLLMIGIVGISNIPGAMQTPEGDVIPPGRLSFANPFGSGGLSWDIFAAPPNQGDAANVDIITFAELVLGLGAIGWIFEGAITGLIAGYVAQVRPDLVDPCGKSGRT